MEGFTGYGSSRSISRKLGISKVRINGEKRTCHWPVTVTCGAQINLPRPCPTKKYSSDDPHGKMNAGLCGETGKLFYRRLPDQLEGSFEDRRGLRRFEE